MALPMHDHDLPPIPPDLAADEPYLPDEVIEGLVDEAVNAADLAVIGAAAAGARVAAEHKAPFVVDDRSKAEWAAAHLASARSDLATLEAQRDAYMERIAAWFDRDSRRAAAKAAFFEALLVGYGLRERAVNPKVATINLPSGSIKTRKSNAAATIANDEAVLDWLHTLDDTGDAIKETVLVSGVRALVDIADGTVVAKGTGEVVPGMAVKPGGYSVSIATD